MNECDNADSITELLIQKHLLINPSSFRLPMTYRFRYLMSRIPVIRDLLKSDQTQSETINALINEQGTCTSYEKWYEISIKLDYLLKNTEWKHALETDLYDYELVLRDLKDLRKARLDKDNVKLLYLVRTRWARNLGGMGNINLYRYSHVGTKKLIEEYIKECEDVLEYLTSEGSNVDDKYCLGMLNQTRKNIGRTALVLSGGGCFGLFHIGVLSSLLEADLLPRIVSGSSAGAIMASILCSKTNEENLPFLATVMDRKFDIFEKHEQKEGLLQHLSRFLKYGTWFDNSYLKETMIEFLGDLTFKECFNRTGKILNITVSPVSIHEQPRLLNYLTAPTVLIWSAVCASCSLPGVFPSSTIYEKIPGSNEIKEWNNVSVKYVDGSVDNDLPIARLSEMFNVDHIIACQVNPHVFPFLKMSSTCIGGDVETEITAKFKTLLCSMYNLFSEEVMHYLSMMEEIGIARNLASKLKSVLAQQYSGDITILPELKISELPLLLVNPTPEFILDALVRGARATWPKITMIRNHCAIEFGLDKAISKLRSKLISKKFGSVYPLVNSPMMSDFSDDTKVLPIRHNRHQSISGDPKSIYIHRNNSVESPRAMSSIHLTNPNDTPKTPHRRKTLSSTNFYFSQPTSPTLYKSEYIDEKKTRNFSATINGTTQPQPDTLLEKLKSVENSPFKTNSTKKYIDGNIYVDTSLNINVDEITSKLSKKQSSNGLSAKAKNERMNLPAQSPSSVRSLRNSLVGLSQLNSKESPRLKRRHSHKSNKSFINPKVMNTAGSYNPEMIKNTNNLSNKTLHLNDYTNNKDDTGLFLGEMKFKVITEADNDSDSANGTANYTSKISNQSGSQKPEMSK